MVDLILQASMTMMTGSSASFQVYSRRGKSGKPV